MATAQQREGERGTVILTRGKRNKKSERMEKGKKRGMKEREKKRRRERGRTDGRGTQLTAMAD